VRVQTQGAAFLAGRAPLPQRAASAGQRPTIPTTSDIALLGTPAPPSLFRVVW